MYQVRTRGNPYASYLAIHLPNKPWFLNFFKISSRAYFSHTWPTRSTKKKYKSILIDRIKRGKENCPEEEHSRRAFLENEHLLCESDPGNQDEQSPWRWYGATMLLHNTCTCRRGKVDGRDLDARGSRVPEAARTIPNSAEAKDRQECAYARRKVVGRWGFSAPLLSLSHLHPSTPSRPIRSPGRFFYLLPNDSPYLSPSPSQSSCSARR